MALGRFEVEFCPLKDGLLRLSPGADNDRYFIGLEHHAFLLGSYRQFLIAAGVGNVLDVGANIGLTVALAHDVGATSITAFEPDPSNFGFLDENVRANGLGAILHNWAVSDRKGSLAFQCDATFGAGSHLTTNDSLWSPSSINVRAAPLDRFRGTFPKIDVLKMDIEGFELAGLAGAKKLIARDKPSAFIELNSWTLMAFANKNPRALVERVRALFPYMLSPRRSGGFASISNDHEMADLLHRNVVENGGVDDLVGTFSVEIRDRLLVA